MNLRALALAALLVAAPAVLVACGDSSSSGSGKSTKLSIVGYSVVQEPYEKITKAYQDTDQGGNTTFSTSYGASGDQSRAVESGLKANYTTFSIAPDVTRLVEAKKVSPDWQDNKYKGFVTESLVVFAVRKGNPKNIKTWDDLVKNDVEIITPNAVASGAARWNILAAYGAEKQEGKTDQQAIDYVEQLLKNTSVQDKSGREALQTFTGGKGDVLLTYENEAITAKNKGLDVDYVIPDDTLLIQNPAAITNEGDTAESQKFLDFVWSDTAQKIFAEAGFRPVNKALVDEEKFPTPSGLFTIEDVGGWPEAGKRFFDEKEGIVTKINEKLGVSNEK